ncbi:hypothetical protein GZL_01677 [Streptomyces sp. 769]|nr:hypothetical protein GZL_01677 [Streptomyces sp. 769]
MYSRLGKPLGEQLIQGGHIIPLRFNRTHSGITHFRQQGTPSIRPTPYGQRSLKISLDLLGEVMPLRLNP